MRVIASDGGLLQGGFLKKEKKNPDEVDGGEKKSCWPSLPISVSQSDEVIKHQPALYINDVTAEEILDTSSRETACLAAEEDFILI